MDLTLSIILAVLLDHWLGEPKKYHPLVFFGQLATSIELKLLRSNTTFFIQKLSGLLALFIVTAPFTLIIYLLTQWETINLIISPIILYFCIAPKSLNQHASNIFQALEHKNLSLAQESVAMIVSRQTEKMTFLDIRKATIESVLENGADAIFAPLFWFILLGPTGAILYRLCNTLDAMWGYKNSRFLSFGWGAARFDDLLNWLPARMTAISYALLGETKLAFYCWKSQARFLASPNAGPVMTSGAGSLNLQLGGPAWYHGQLKQKILFGTARQCNNNDITRANSLIYLTLIFLVLAVFILELIGEYFA